MGLVQVTPPAEYPISLVEAKLHLRVDHDDEDDLITTLIAASTEWLENALDRKLVAGSWRLELASFASVIELPYPPLVSVDQVQYVDLDGTTQVVAESVYEVDTTVSPGRLMLADGQSWPSTKLTNAAALISFSAGYGAAADVPAMAKAAIKLLVGHWYENRETAVAGLQVKESPMAVQAIVHSLRSYRFC